MRVTMVNDDAARTDMRSITRHPLCSIMHDAKMPQRIIDDVTPCTNGSTECQRLNRDLNHFCEALSHVVRCQSKLTVVQKTVDHQR
jgi:hypothetical protein